MEQQQHRSRQIADSRSVIAEVSSQIQISNRSDRQSEY